MQVVSHAADKKKCLRVIGEGNSPSDICCTDEYMVSLKYYNKVLEVSNIYLLGMESFLEKDSYLKQMFRYMKKKSFLAGPLLT